MRTYLLINTLFKTAEYKLVDSDCLKITELSLFGVKSKKVLLDSVKREESQSIPTCVTYLVLIFGFSLVATAIYLSQYSALLSNNLLNIIFFLTCITSALAFICRPVKTLIYRDIHSKNTLLKVNQSAMINNATDQFVNDLNTAIDTIKAKESNTLNSNTNAKIQYDIHNKNVDELFNLGFIDEALYNNICSSMHEKIFGNINKQITSNNIIYLNR